MKILLMTSVITGLISTSGCACMQHPDPRPDHEMDTLGKQLVDLTAAVDGTLREDPAGTADLADRALLERATAHDPALLKPFDGYQVTTTRAGSTFSVLVCTRDGAHALLEDASCTPELDRKPWQQSPAAACQPTLQLPVVCKP